MRDQTTSPVPVIPTIDLLGGQAVRLVRGEHRTQRVVWPDPLEAARHWSREGATWLHVVDLDAARTGRQVNLDVIRRIAGEVDIPVQAGGGVRGAADVERLLNAGAARVVVGTLAVEQPAELGRLRRRFGDLVLPSLDWRRGRLVAHGWTRARALPHLLLAQRLRDLGFELVVATDTERDGTLSFRRGGFWKHLLTLGFRPIVAGGVGGLADLAYLATHIRSGLAGVIVGTALYQGRFTLSEAQAVLDHGADSACPG